MGRLSEWFTVAGTMIAKGSHVALEQTRRFIVTTFWLLLALAIIAVIGLVFKIQILVVVPVVVVALITMLLFAALRFISQYMKVLEGAAWSVGSFAVWLLFLGFLTAIHPEWFYFHSGQLQNLLIFGIAGLFCSFFLTYIGSKSHVVSVFLAVCVVAITLLYGLQLYRPGLYDRLVSKRPNQAVTRAELIETAIGYELKNNQLAPAQDIKLVVGDKVAVLDTLPREFGGEQFIECMLSNTYGDFVGGTKIWLPKRKLRHQAQLSAQERDKLWAKRREDTEEFLQLKKKVESIGTAQPGVSSVSDPHAYLLGRQRDVDVDAIIAACADRAQQAQLNEAVTSNTLAIQQNAEDIKNLRQEVTTGFTQLGKKLDDLKPSAPH